ncbi:MAG: sigma-70 family RNA polymerase sigma factor [Bacteroides sp.]|nr:sigma-70 family RNA polymerase sigma factor [Bacteroides sp.]MCM1379011.1 sigma-70 family RNA polymerase sigma factor [Bacteroides sp.]MCM1445627.1 sigma-70 family RNA polymerase sigma factor [Prevotella sp.]
MTKLTDKELVAAYANGDNMAFDTLLNRYEKPVFNYILHTVKDEDLANDIFQETFVKAITVIRQGRYEDNGKFGAWLTRVAHNLVIDHFRRNKAENTISNDADEENDLFNDKDLCEASVEELMCQTQLTRDIRRMVRELPETQRQVLMMRIYRDMSFKEIAEVTGVSINTALGRMRYALKNMRRMADECRLLETA